jgi:hypothetical protein
MAGRTKQFKIGEYVVGGIIQVNIVGNNITINFRDYFSKEVILTEDFVSDSDRGYIEVHNYLLHNGTVYYTDKVIKWIESIVPLKPQVGW